MSEHLSEDRISELVDGEGASAEVLHLGACGECAARLEQARWIRSQLAAARLVAAPAGLEARVMSGARRDRMSRRLWSGALRIAAALALVAGGVVAGRVTAPPASPPVAAADSLILTSTGNPAARLALLEAVSLTASAALRSAPEDPGIRAVHTRVTAERVRLSKAVAAGAPAGSRWF